MNRHALLLATGGITVWQVVMVVLGHFIPAIAAFFALGGMGLSFAAGLIFARLARPGWTAALLGGAIAGGVSGLIGIAVSHLLGDVPASLLLFGTAGSAVAGLLGGVAGRLFGGRRSAAT
jgi:hypothetical protein